MSGAGGRGGPQGRGGRGGSSSGGRGGGPAQTAGPKRPHENGNAAAKPEGGAPAQDNPVTQPKPGGASAWGNKTSFASLLKTSASAKSDDVPKATPDAAGGSVKAPGQASAAAAAAAPGKGATGPIQFGSFQPSDGGQAKQGQEAAPARQQSARSDTSGHAAAGAPEGRGGNDRRGGQPHGNRGQGAPGPRQGQNKPHTAPTPPAQAQPAQAPAVPPPPPPPPAAASNHEAAPVPSTMPTAAPAPPPVPAKVPTAVPSAYPPNIPAPPAPAAHPVAPAAPATAPITIPVQQPPPPAPIARSSDSNKSQPHGQHHVGSHGAPGHQGGRVVAPGRQDMHQHMAHQGRPQQYGNMVRPGGQMPGPVPGIPTMAGGFTPAGFNTFQMPPLPPMPFTMSPAIGIYGGFPGMPQGMPNQAMMYQAANIPYMTPAGQNSALAMSAQAALLAQQQQGHNMQHGMQQGHGGAHVNHHPQHQQHVPQHQQQQQQQQQGHSKPQGGAPNVPPPQPRPPAVSPTQPAQPPQPPPRKALVIKSATGAPLDLHDIKKNTAPAEPAAAAKPAATSTPAPAAAAAAPAAAPAAAATTAAAKPAATVVQPAAGTAAREIKPAPAGTAAREIKAPPPEMLSKVKPQAVSSPAAPAAAAATASASSSPAPAAPAQQAVAQPAAAEQPAVNEAPAAAKAEDKPQSDAAKEPVKAPAAEKPAVTPVAAAAEPEPVPTSRSPAPPATPENPAPTQPATVSDSSAKEPSPSPAVSSAREEASNGATLAAPAPAAAAAVEAPAAAAAAKSVVPEEPAAAPVKGKKNLKDIAKKADAIEDLSSRVDPFAAPQKAAPPPPPPPPARAAPKQPEPEKLAEPEQPKEAANDNWEDAAEQGVTPPVQGGAPGADEAASGRRVYTRDFLRSLARCYDRPAELEECAYARELLLDAPRAFDMQDVTFDMSSMGAGIRRGPGGGGGGGGRPGDDWGARRGPGGNQYQPQDGRMGGGRGGGMGRDGPRGQMDRRGSQQLDDKWERRGPPPSPGGRGPGSRADSMSMSRANSMLHRTENRFVAGQSTADDPEEEKRQKQILGILNKITPDNFERLTNKIVDEVGIVEMRTLEGLINKIFDKALNDTHFCELYANMVRSLSDNPKCPKFPPEEPGGKPVDLRRLLLFKCQTEFETGVKAMEDVAAQEAKDAETGAEDKELEEGEISTPAASEGAATKTEGETEDAPAKPLTAAEQRAAERKKAEADRAARRRMLGNIQFIGHLFKEHLLTERIIHSCIQTLLREQNAPRPEDVECLCKLLTTVGGKLDSTTKPEFSKAVTAFFNRLQLLRENQNLESRIRFMVQDVLDLRENNWVPRTKKEGPKKIQDIHREAQREMDMQAQRDRDERQRDRRGGGDRYGGPPPPRAPNTYDRLVSKDEMLSKPMASMNRATSSELSFRPQGGGFGAKGGNRNPSPAAAAAAASAASNLPNSGSGRHQPQQPSSRTATPPPPPPPPTTMSPEDMRKDVNKAVEEFWDSDCKQDEIIHSFKLIREAGGDMSNLLPLVLTAALERRGVDFAKRLLPFEEVFNTALTKEAGEGGVTAQEMQAGALAIMRDLHNLCEDQPKAPTSMGHFLAVYVASGQVSLGPVLNEVLSVPPMEDEEDPPLVVAGGASDLVFALMKRLVEDAGQEKAAEQWSGSGLALSAFFDSFTREEPEQIAKQAEKAGLAFLAA